MAAPRATRSPRWALRGRRGRLQAPGGLPPSWRVLAACAAPLPLPLSLSLPLHSTPLPAAGRLNAQRLATHHV